MLCVGGRYGTKWRRRDTKIQKGYKLLYSCADGTRNVVIVVKGQDLSDMIVYAKRVCYRMLSKKLALQKRCIYY